MMPAPETTLAIVFQLTQLLLVVLAAPLLTGWVNQCQAWLQNRSGAGVLQPYRVLHKLFRKDAVMAHNASLAVPHHALYRVRLHVAGRRHHPCHRGRPAVLARGRRDRAGRRVRAGAQCSSRWRRWTSARRSVRLGARREMLVSFLAEPALLMVLFTASMISHSTQLPSIVQALAHHEFVLYPSLAFAALAFVIVLLAENARIPVDNPSTHLELTMIHEAMILEYSARHLALIEWASSLKLFAYISIGIALFLPHGIAAVGDWAGLPLALALLVPKLMLAGAGLALLEAVSAKMRIFRAPEFLGTAFLLAVLGLLIHFLLGA